MLRYTFVYYFLQSVVFLGCFVPLSASYANESDINKLQQKVEQLEQELQEAQSALANAEQQRNTALSKVEQAENKLTEINSKDEGIVFVVVN